MSWLKGKEVVIWDTEYTAWEDCNEHGWDPQKNQYKELVQIGAILVDVKSLEIKREFSIIIKPKINPRLSSYFKNLTGIKQRRVDSAKNPEEGIRYFLEFVGKKNCYSYGKDFLILFENIELNNLKLKPLKNNFYNVEEIFSYYGINVEKFHSGNITEAFGVKNKNRAHDALSDSKSILEGLRLYKNKNL